MKTKSASVAGLLCRLFQGPKTPKRLEWKYAPTVASLEGNGTSGLARAIICPSSLRPHCLPKGFLIVDRYNPHKKFVKTTSMIICFFWAHQRRDFLEVANQWPQIESWAMEWVEAIGNLYHLNDLRLAEQKDCRAHAFADARLRQAVDEMTSKRHEQLAQAHLHPVAQKVLQSMENHWGGLTVFVDHPQVPMDNNRAEQAQRGPAVGRKNYYGAGSLWSGNLCATLFSLFQTLLLWEINPKLWLTGFLWACAKNDGLPLNDIACWLPWNMNEQQRSALSIEPKIMDSS